MLCVVEFPFVERRFKHYNSLFLCCLNCSRRRRDSFCVFYLISFSLHSELLYYLLVIIEVINHYRLYIYIYTDISIEIYVLQVRTRLDELRRHIYKAPKYLIYYCDIYECIVPCLRCWLVRSCNTVFLFSNLFYFYFLLRPCGKYRYFGLRIIAKDHYNTSVHLRNIGITSTILLYHIHATRLWISMTTTMNEVLRSNNILFTPTIVCTQSGPTWYYILYFIKKNCTYWMRVKGRGTTLVI